MAKTSFPYYLHVVIQTVTGAALEGETGWQVTEPGDIPGIISTEGINQIYAYGVTGKGTKESPRVYQEVTGFEVSANRLTRKRIPL